MRHTRVADITQTIPFAKKFAKKTTASSKNVRKQLPIPSKQKIGEGKKICPYYTGAMGRALLEHRSTIISTTNHPIIQGICLVLLDIFWFVVSLLLTKMGPQIFFDAPKKNVTCS
jgi:hypothetical protein